ncbi:hypothetical protein GOP47_0009809 [Adiantum capillus-veneris]|uniref:DNA/pantothenate metabolism flavoprotein C-terminal domain-containing protein n=1 Tax=Adiantum capillus-veneris TaxID=13818 RepID=A0A9D4UXA3_ADICA|nr:hypothetical protein GOP47_0009809 [Adiantum capillus-veneris]
MEADFQFGDVEELFRSAPTLKDEFVIRENLEKFIHRNCELGRRLVCITSGGTSAPLERNCVRFLHNFSSGNRGAVSTEYFLQAGYAVIFLYKRNSSQPYCRRIVECFKPDHSSSVQDRIELMECAVQSYHESVVQGKLLEVSYETIFQYLQLLRLIARNMNCLEKNAMFYLAAAVADFYVPWEAMDEHKIQSREGPLTIQLALVPKMIKVLRKQWAPSAFCVSFKLETDSTILMKKAKEALHKYNVHAVVANELTTRNEKVIVVTNEGEKTIEKDLDVEMPLVQFLKERHREFIECK